MLSWGVWVTLSLVAGVSVYISFSVMRLTPRLARQVKLYITPSSIRRPGCHITSTVHLGSFVRMVLHWVKILFWNGTFMTLHTIIYISEVTKKNHYFFLGMKITIIIMVAKFRPINSTSIIQFCAYELSSPFSLILFDNFLGISNSAIYWIDVVKLFSLCLPYLGDLRSVLIIIIQNSMWQYVVFISLRIFHILFACIFFHSSLFFLPQNNLIFLF